jgi:hypothetical protein
VQGIVGKNVSCTRTRARRHCLVKRSPFSLQAVSALARVVIDPHGRIERASNRAQQRMRVFLHGACHRLSLGVGLPLLAVALLAPSSARAGCGDHVLVTPAAKAISHSPVSVPEPPAKKQAPCSGPHCSHAPITPPPAPVVPVPTGGHEWACVLLPIAMPAETSSPYIPDNHVVSPLPNGSGVYHPPR